MREVELTQRKPISEEPEGIMTEETTTLIEGSNVTRKTTRRLYTWDEIPEWQKDNEHILSGYIFETKSFRSCIKSLFYLHNESVNIYTHLLPGICFFLVAIFNQYAIEHFETTRLIDYIMIDLFFLGGFICLMMSSLFHCLKCHSIEVAVFGNKLDYLGIVALVVSSMVSILYYGFYDYWPFFLIFSGITVTFGIACAVVSLGDTFRSREWRPYRASLFVAFGLSALLPVIAGILHYGFHATWAKIQLKWLILEGVFYILGAVLYGVRFPERISPGTFDMWGHSHQLFHVLVVIAALCHLQALIGAYKFVHKNLIG
ncbi:LANO_0A06546g1_1 [Lachancea nothofagi CBS 11611]|uniref:LANO_0A06546g1_1 n=1 Tax=Lachancea nothofagi CBS 11611 TaxID=1266666 RepID=A0A1G4IS47_9SACH|nr:LANO_0A06546g1_1 [Lachancea nothofagi CBS 11611]